MYNAIRIAEQMNCPSYLNLDAYFAVGPMFLAAASVYSLAAKVPWVHIIVRAKKSATAYLDPELSPPGKKGQKKKYGKSLKLKSLFKDKAEEFQEIPCCVYGNIEMVKILCLDLLWKLIKGKIRFVLAVTSKGPIVLICSDLSLCAIQILELCPRRASIESTFSVLKNLIGGLVYHFWSTKIEKSSRRPKKNKDANANIQTSEEFIKDKLRAIEMFVNMSAILVGILQIMALQFPKKIWKDNIHWLRTVSNKIPSEYIVKGVLLKRNL